MYAQTNMPSSVRKYGFSLIEALFAMVLISIVVASIAPVFASYTRINRETEIRSDATVVGERYLDELRQTRIEQWPVTGTLVDSITSGRTYTTRLVHQAFPDTTGLQELRVEVSFNGKTYFTATTVLTNL